MTDIGIGNRVLVRKIETTIDKIQTKKCASHCDAHADIADGLILLLEVAKITLTQQAKYAVVAGISSSITIGIGLGIIALLRQFGIV
jgi:hypothetical protein